MSLITETNTAGALAAMEAAFKAACTAAEDPRVASNPAVVAALAAAKAAHNAVIVAVRDAEAVGFFSTPCIIHARADSDDFDQRIKRWFQKFRPELMSEISFPNDNESSTEYNSDSGHRVTEYTLALSRIERYRQISAVIEHIEARHENELKDLKSIRNELSGLVMQFIEQTRQTSAKTPVGTAAIAVRWTAPLADPDAFMRYVLENGAFDLLELRAN